MKSEKGNKGSAPLFAFGHGLSYTTFSSFASVPLPTSCEIFGLDETLTFTIPVTNTGRVAGAETVQLYIHDREASVERPYKELKAFSKVFLQPGETRQVTLTIDRRNLSYDHEAT